jgi:hypothetical protein
MKNQKDAIGFTHAKLLLVHWFGVEGADELSCLVSMHTVRLHHFKFVQGCV